MDIEDDLFGPGDGDDNGGEGGNADGGGQEQGVTQEAPKDEGKDLGADGKPQEGPAEGDQGKPEGGEPKAEKQEGDKPEGDDKKDEKYVPKAALDSEKRRRRELKARIDAMEERERQREAAAAEASAPKPGQPGYEEFRERQTSMMAINQNLNRSEYDVRKAHGDDKVDEMMAWASEQFAAKPEWAKQVFGHAHPYDFAMDAYLADLAAKDKPNDHGDPEYAAFLAFKEKMAGGGDKNAPPASPQGGAPKNVPDAPVPVSIGQRPSASGPSAPVSSKDAFDQEFG